MKEKLIWASYQETRSQAASQQESGSLLWLFPLRLFSGWLDTSADVQSERRDTMFNNHLANEEVKERIEERMKEAETYSLQKRLGYGDSGAARWIFALIMVMAVVAVGLLL